MATIGHTTPQPITTISHLLFISTPPFIPCDAPQASRVAHFALAVVVHASRPLDPGAAPTRGFARAGSPASDPTARTNV